MARFVLHLSLHLSLHLIHASALHSAPIQLSSFLFLQQEAQKQLILAKKDIKQASKELADSAKLLEDTINAALFKAERENSTVYLQRITKPADLPAIVGASLVKSIPPADLDASADDLFSGVVPDTR